MQLGKMLKAQMAAWMLENGWGQQNEENVENQEELWAVYQQNWV